MGGITFGVDDDGNYGYIKAGADTVTPISSQNAYIYDLTLGIAQISTQKLDIIPSELYVAIAYNDKPNDFLQILKSKYMLIKKHGAFAPSVVVSYDSTTNSVEVNQMYGYGGFSCTIIAIK